MKIETLRETVLAAVRTYTQEIHELYGQEMKATIQVSSVAARAGIDTCSAILGLTKCVEEGEIIRESAGGTPLYSLNLEV